MWKPSYFGPVVLCAMGVTLALGLGQIFRIQLVSGDLYPAWSSLRSDPDGTRVLFDSLAGTGRFETVRNFKRLDEIHERNATILLAGYGPTALIRASSGELDAFEKAARSGNRVVIGIDAGDDNDGALPRKDDPRSGLTKRWGIGIERGYFGKSDGWTQDVAANGRPVIIERAFGLGSIVVCASSRVFANRNLAAKRDSGLLVGLIGPNVRVVFDEAHLGVQDNGSVVGLIHKYRLDGALWGLLALAIVFIWSHAAGFPPPLAAPANKTTGHDAHAGLQQLLRRQIPASRIMETCIFQWERFNARTKHGTVTGHKDPIAAYREFQQELTRK